MIPEVKSSVLNLKSIRGATTKEENLEKTRRKFLMRAPSVMASNRKLIDEDEVSLVCQLCSTCLTVNRLIILN
jgi:hypothetical protein